MAVNFEMIRKRIDDMRLFYEEGGAANLETVLRERSKALASRVHQVETRTLVAECIVMRRGRNRLAVPITGVQELRLVQIAALPFATPFVPGMFQVRGRVGCLLDVEPFYNRVTPVETGGRIQIAVVESPMGLHGLRIDEVLGARLIYADEKLESLNERKHDFVSFVTRDLISLIDIERLLQRPEFVLSA